MGSGAPEQKGRAVLCVLRLVLLSCGGQAEARTREGLFQASARRWREHGREVDGFKMVV